MQTWIRAAGKHLLDVLKAEKAVNYSRFYNATPGNDAALADSLCGKLEAEGDAEKNDEDEDGDDVRRTFVDEGHLYVEWAAWQLYDRGVVKIATLDGAKLIDGEPDYRIELTSMGEKFVAKGAKFKFRHLDSRFSGTAASRWLISFVDNNSDIPEGFELGGIMEVGESDGGVKVADDCKNAYPLGSPVYAWAFEVCLWHHARSGNVVLAYEKPGQEAVWKELMGRQHLFGRPDVDAENPLWRVPFRLKDGLDAEKIRHVGWFGGE